MDNVHKLTPKPAKAFAAPDPEHCETMLERRAGVDEIDRMLVALIARRQGYMDAAARIKPSRDVVPDETRINPGLANGKAKPERPGLSWALPQPVWPGKEGTAALPKKFEVLGTPTAG